ncbi:P-loop NTPase fold protein [Aliarcobacter cryaerophilus]|uniref:P-loop NTPase fold protein n=1 Tax=Aliarcobacter cryaerophilus TaxID=28198 RepID=UPI00112F2CE9|nr:P-loop NTPase fold protein [Aliarcobacter cryaerophilus]
MTNKDSLIIPLRKSTNATVLNEERYLLQQKALKDITEILDNNLDKIIHNNINELDRNHETITLLGERGTGKTSFLINFKNYYKRKSEVVFLDTIDPTLFEDRQNIMITIISMIYKEIEKEKLHENENWLDKLSSLSEGLNLLDGVGSDPLKKDIWDDPRIILEIGLKNANSGLKLEENFNLFIKESLRLLNRKMFIITFDDIDTDIKKGWPVLEVIRKYMTSPHIQIIISGDWNLYSKIVRLHQWKQIKETPEHSVDNDRIVINQLEEQYLTKILKPENRIVLKDLRFIINDGYKIIIDDSKTKIDDLDLKNIYRNIFSDILFIESDKTIEKFVSLLLSLPVRTNIQILIAYFDYMHENIKNESKDKKYNKKFFLEKLSNIFITKIARFNFSDKDFDALTSEEVISFLIKKLYEINKDQDHDFIDLFNFNPIYDSEDMNIFIMVLNAYVVNIINNNPYKIFEWLFRIQYFNKFLIEKFDYKLIYNYLSCNINTKVIEQSTKIIGLSHPNTTTGFYKIYMYHIRRHNKSLKGLDKFISDIKNDGTFSKDTKLTFEFLINISLREIKDKKETETKAYVSLLNVFSFISESLKNTSNINNLVRKQTIFCYSENNNIDSTIYYENDDEDYSELSIIKEYNKWLELSKKLKPISIELLNSIWTEYYITLEQLPPIDNYKDLLEHQLIRLFNTIVKEIERKKKNSSESFPSIKTNLERFENRSIKKSSYEDFFNKIKTNPSFENFDELDLFEFLSICPLWKYYVDFPIPEFIENFGLDFGLGDSRRYSDVFKTLSLSKDNYENIPINDSVEIEDYIKEESIEQIKKDENLAINTLEDNLESEEYIVTYLIKKYEENINDKNVVKFIWDKMRTEYSQFKGQRKRKGRDKLIEELYHKIKNPLY